MLGERTKNGLLAPEVLRKPNRCKLETAGPGIRCHSEQIRRIGEEPVFALGHNWGNPELATLPASPVPPPAELPKSLPPDAGSVP